MDDLRDARLARNESVFRELNEEIEQLSDRFEVRLEGTGIDFVCECSSLDCGETVRLAREAYERVRQDGTRFVIRPEHHNAEVEDVVERHPEHWVVQKHEGVPADRARRSDPR
jgi:hypothetical protein